jgi:hypothetical protein
VIRGWIWEISGSAQLRSAQTHTSTVTPLYRCTADTHAGSTVPPSDGTPESPALMVTVYNSLAWPRVERVAVPVSPCTKTHQLKVVGEQCHGAHTRLSQHASVNQPAQPSCPEVARVPDSGQLLTHGGSACLSACLGHDAQRTTLVHTDLHKALCAQVSCTYLPAQCHHFLCNLHPCSQTTRGSPCRQAWCPSTTAPPGCSAHSAWRPFGPTPAMRTLQGRRWEGLVGVGGMRVLHAWGHCMCGSDILRGMSGCR